MGKQCAACGLEVLAWCLMPNHVHLVAVPRTQDALAGEFRGSSGDTSLNWLTCISQVGRLGVWLDLHAWWCQDTRII